MQQETQQKQAKTKASVPATKTAAAPPVKSADFADGGWDTEVVDTKDIIIPKILLMHPTSELVKEGKRNQGDIIKSTSEETIAKRGETFDVIVFAKWKEWRIMKKKEDSDRYEYVRLEPWTDENDSDPWDYEEDGQVMRRDKTLNFYAILAKEAEQGNAFPVKLSFVRTGFRTGHKIADAYSRALMEKQPPTRQLFRIGSELVQGKEESFFAFTATPGEATTELQKQNALHWRMVVNKAKQTNSVVDHEVDEPVVVAEATTEF